MSKGESIIEISIDKLRPNPYNPRKTFDDVQLVELAKSIMELGLLQPLVVYPENEHYNVICGDRRLAACVQIGMKEIPCREIEPPKDQAHAVQIALVENLQRADLTAVEEAIAIHDLIEAGAKRAAVAKALGKSSTYVSQRYLLGKHKDVIEAFIAGGEKDLAGYALLAKVDDKKIRAKIIKTVKNRSYGGWASTPSGFKDDIESIVRLQGFEDLEGMVISDFVSEYDNPEQHIMPCLRGYGADRYKCPQYAELSYQVRDWLGSKGKSTRAICANDQKACLEFKRQAEEKIQEKVDKIDSARLLDTARRWEGTERVEIDMRELGDKKCEKCKSFFDLPAGFHYGRDFEYPFLYCMAKDSKCFDAKKKLYDEATKREGGDRESPYISQEDLEAKTDEELKEMIDTQEISYILAEVCYGRPQRVLFSRGLYPVPTLSIEWRQFEPSESCDKECICHTDYDGELKDLDLECFDSCPHLNKEEVQT